MLRAFLICPDQELTQNLESLVAESQHMGVVRKVDRYLSGVELTRFLRAHAPHVVLLSIENMAKAVETVDTIEATVPGIQTVVVSRNADPQVLLELMRKGVREFLSAPFRRQELYEAIGRLQENAEKRPPAYDSTELMFTFLPSKPGVGASTIAMNVTHAAARQAGTKCLLMDWDLNNGMQRFMLKLHNDYTILDAAENAFNLDENMWPQLVSTVGQMDVLHAGKMDPNMRVEATQVRHMIDFIRRIYRLVSIDLSGNMEKYSFELMHESKKIFVVCTPEITSLHLAREKISFLKTLDLGDRISVLLNRAQKRAVVSAGQIEDLLGVSVLMALPNDYQGVHRAVQAGKPVEQGSDLGKQYTKLAASLLEKETIQPAEHKRRFVEYFSMFPSKSPLADAKKTAI